MIAKVRGVLPSPTVDPHIWGAACPAQVFQHKKKVKRKKNIFYAASLSWDGWSPSSLHSPTLYSGIIKAKHLKRRFGAVRPVRKKVLLLKAPLVQGESSVQYILCVFSVFLFPSWLYLSADCMLGMDSVGHSHQQPGKSGNKFLQIETSFPGGSSGWPTCQD